MGHLPLEALNRRLAEAASKVKIGARYGHYKHPDQPYLVTGLVILEATDEVAVAYGVEEGGQQITFVRPLESWLETVTWQGQTVPRFRLIEE